MKVYICLQKFIKKKKVKGAKRYKVKKLITDLCNPDPNKRLTDFNIIEKRLNEIG